LAFKRNLKRAINALVNKEFGGRIDIFSVKLPLKLKRTVHLNRNLEETGYLGQDPEGKADETGQD
jgi:hypothetical protein